MSRCFLPVWSVLSAGFLSQTVPSLSHADEPIPGYPAGIREVRYPVETDRSEQPALFWKPETPGERRPLLVALHTWSGNHRQTGGETVYARWCLRNDWIFFHPNFRGPNRTPEAMGSDLMIADIRSGVEWVKSRANVDETRIYAIGVSGGGHATQLIAGRMPEVWAGISSWCGISDIAAWHRETSEAGRTKYAKDIEAALGGNPNADETFAAEAHHRSPVNWLSAAGSVPLDLSHGVHDGRTGSVPFTHSLHAWNSIVPRTKRFPENWIARFYETQEPPSGGKPEPDPLFGKKPPLFRKVHGNTRITIFDGGHEIIHLAALNWLAAQQKGKPVNWTPPLFSPLETSERESESGK